jgi:hypothetical protein
MSQSETPVIELKNVNKHKQNSLQVLKIIMRRQLLQRKLAGRKWRLNYRPQTLNKQ